MGLTSELIRVINKYIDETRWMPVELKPLMKEASPSPIPNGLFGRARLPVKFDLSLRATLCHCERSEAISWSLLGSARLLRRYAPRNDRGSIPMTEGRSQ